MSSYYNYFPVLHRRPNAFAEVMGGEEYPTIRGRVFFWGLRGGVLVRADVMGLPMGDNECDEPVFGFHIHEGGTCDDVMREDSMEEFAATRGHYNPYSCRHPYHAGDMPPLFGVNGNAFMVFMTDRFTISEIEGKTVVIHSEPDDFTSQPAGNAGEKIACGVIIPTRR